MALAMAMVAVAMVATTMARGALMLKLSPTTMVAMALAMAMVAMAMATMAMARGALMLMPSPTTMVDMAAMAMEVMDMEATSGAKKDYAKHNEYILSLFRTGQLLVQQPTLCWS